MSGPWNRVEAAPSTPPAPERPHVPVTEARINSTDFVAAQRDNRFKTWVLILALINIGFLLGYVLGWSVEAWTTDAGRFQLAAVSSLGLLGGAALAGVGIVSA